MYMEMVQNVLHASLYATR